MRVIGKIKFGMGKGNILLMMDLDMKLNKKMALKTKWEF